MNWKRGLLRTWVLGSLLWLAGWLIYVWQSCYTQEIPASLGGGRAKFCHTSLLSDWDSQPQYFGFSDYVHIVATGIAPIACLVIGYGIWWVVQGFGNRPPSN
jgi:hypothetical protein